MEFSEEIDYQKKAAVHSNYKYVRYNQIQGGSSTTLSLTSTSQSQFEISGQNVINLSKSKLCFDLLTAAGGASNYTYTNANGLGLFDRITLTTRSGIVLCDMPYTYIYGSLCSAVKTKREDFLNKSVLSNELLTTPATVANSRLDAVEDIFPCNSTSALNFNCTGLGGSTPYREPAYILRATTTNTATAISYQLKLSSFKDTILELDKSLLFGENLILNIYWAPTTKFQFISTSASVPGTGEADGPLPAMSNLYLYVCQDLNQNIRNQLASKISSSEGLSILVPYLYGQLYSSSTTTLLSIQQRLNRSYGETLLRVYLGVYNTTDKWSTAVDHDQVGITSFNTSLDSVRLQDFLLSNADSTDWLYNEFNFNNSAMLNQKQYFNNYMHIDNFCGNSVADTDSTISDGLVLNTDRTWSANFDVTSGSYRVYAFFVTQKRLTISNGVITIA